MSPEQVTALRQKLWRMCYRPIAVHNWNARVRSPGKQPDGEAWQIRALRNPPDAAARDADPQCLNTGILCSGLRAIDIDFPDFDEAAALRELAIKIFGNTIIRTRGNSGKMLMLYRAAVGEPPKRVISTTRDRKVEVLGAGQQFVAYGTHETRVPLEWHNGSPETVPYDFLEEVTEQQIDEYFAAVQLLHPEAKERDAKRPRLQVKPGLPPDEHAAAVLAAVPAMFSENDPRHYTMVDVMYDDLAPMVKSGHLDEALAIEVCTAGMASAGRAPRPGEVEDVLDWCLPRVDAYEPETHGEEFGDADPDARPARPTNLPTIHILAGKMPDIVESAEDALLAADMPIYQRGGAVVTSGPMRERESKGNYRQVVGIVDVSVLGLTHILDQVARWLKYNDRDKRDVIIGCPPDVAARYLALAGAGWRLPVLTGLINTPTLRHDGSILNKPGYDEATGLLYDPRAVVFPAIPLNPSKADAALALTKLTALLREFPFVEPVDRSVALSMLLSAMVRRSLPTCPMHALTAPTPGTGKSHLLNLAAMLSTGRTAAGVGWRAGDDAECAKVLDGALLDGSPILALDNIEGELRGARLAVILSEPDIMVRPLGESRQVRVPCSALVVANGNNIVIAADLTRRSILCRLDARVERPELREFQRDPIADVQANRGSYVAAALTVLRAYIVAGRPERPSQFGGYEAWSDLVRGALVWLGQPDPVASMETVRAADPRRNELHAVMSQWGVHIGSAPVTVTSVVTAALGQPEFKEALLAVAGQAGDVNTRRLGYWLRANKGKLLDGMHMELAGDSHGTALWRLIGCGSPAGVGSTA